MGSGRWWRVAFGVARRIFCTGRLLAAFGVIALSACTSDQIQVASLAEPRGATVAFDSIDGPPPEQFHKLVGRLNDEARTRRLAVMSRESPSTYRVRGYLAAARAKGKTTVTWVWDVFDANQQRALRIDGAETVKARNHDAWAAVDDDMLSRIAHSSMDQLAAFLTSPEVAPTIPNAVPAVALVGDTDSPEAAGIFRIFHPVADPVSGDAAEPAADVKPAGGPMPLSPRRPQDATVSSNETVTVAASSR
jgi:hypothetical protein